MPQLRAISKEEATKRLAMAIETGPALTYPSIPTSGHTHPSTTIPLFTPPPVMAPTPGHPLGVVGFMCNVSIPYSDLTNNDLTIDDLLRKHLPKTLKHLVTQIENWRASNDLEPITKEEATHAAKN